MTALKLGFMAPRPGPQARVTVREAERLGYATIWTAENYGYDCFTSLGWWAGQTSTIGLGTTVAVMDARTPTMTAMTAASLDALSDGRFTLGLGVSGPQVVEGWYGRDFRKPIARTRECVEILRKVLRRDGPVEYSGEFYELPLTSTGTGLAKALKLIPHPLRPDLPIQLAAEGPKNVALAAEVADGWCGFYMAPESDDMHRGWLEEGFARRPGGRPDGFEVVSQVSISVNDDLDAAADAVRPSVAFMVGGMGAPSANYHYQALARAGFEGECERILNRWTDGDRDGATAVVTNPMVDATALVGSWARIGDLIARWSETIVTALLVTPAKGTALTEASVADLARAAWS
jgi:F420-dependent oxidoreductase-like protein